MASLEFSVYTITSSANRNNFTSFQIWKLFASFSCLIVPTRIFSTDMTRSDENEYPYLAPDHAGKKKKHLDKKTLYHLER